MLAEAAESLLTYLLANFNKLLQIITKLRWSNKDNNN